MKDIRLCWDDIPRCKGWLFGGTEVEGVFVKSAAISSEVGINIKHGLI